MAGSVPATKVVSILNLKGGVAKTTLTVALADAFAIQGKRVLVVDVDPQCDTSIMLVGQARWKDDLHAKNRTLAPFFFQSKEAAEVEACLEPEVSDIRGVHNISLLAADMKLSDIQNGLLPKGQTVSRAVLARLLGQLKGLFDLVLIDCPPNFSILTQNALAASHSYIMPAIPDYLSLTLAATRTKEYVERLNNKRPKAPVKLAGIVLTKYQSNNTVHRELTGRINADNRALWKDMLRNHIIPQTTDLTEAAQYDPNRRTNSEKYPQGLSKSFRELATALWPRF
ncbi:MAG: AAA family ATPase [Candidatus Adiutrix sp.]|jgi:chromosome partitioning protein|nr:AAA family ATPase [Candidatus Adiutrix sp.]